MTLFFQHGVERFGCHSPSVLDVHNKIVKFLGGILRNAFGLEIFLQDGDLTVEVFDNRLVDGFNMFANFRDVVLGLRWRHRFSWCRAVEKGEVRGLDSKTLQLDRRESSGRAGDQVEGAQKFIGS